MELVPPFLGCKGTENAEGWLHHHPWRACSRHVHVTPSPPPRSAAPRRHHPWTLHHGSDQQNCRPLCCLCRLRGCARAEPVDALVGEGHRRSPRTWQLGGGEHGPLRRPEGGVQPRRGVARCGCRAVRDRTASPLAGPLEGGAPRPERTPAAAPWPRGCPPGWPRNAPSPPFTLGPPSTSPSPVLTPPVSLSAPPAHPRRPRACPPSHVCEQRSTRTARRHSTAGWASPPSVRRPPRRRRRR